MTGEAYTIAVTYLRIDAVGHMLISLTLVGCAALRGVGNMRTPMFIFAIINAVNVIASCTLVFGLGPFPALGVTGIVVGTVIAKALGAILIVVVLLRGRSGLKLRYDQLPIAWTRTWRILRIGLPAAADGALMWSGHFAFLAIISRLADPPWGELYFAAHIVAVRVEALTYLPAFAWAAASATMIGQALGADNPARARRVGHEAVLQCGLLSVVIAACFYFGAAVIYEKMSLDPLVRAAGVRPFQVLALLQPLLAVAIIYVGSLRGAGDTRFPMLITLIGILIRIPTGYYFGIVLGWGLIGAWTGMFGDMIWRALSSTIRYVGGRWVRTRV
jgi:putative MATE family efflux protein